MRTPKEYSEYAKKGIVTLAMVENVLYSLNKRAKNYRDKARGYRESNSIYSYDYDEKKWEYYQKKTDILSHCTCRLSAVHAVSTTIKRKYTEDDDEYYRYGAEITRYSHGEESSI